MKKNVLLTIRLNPEKNVHERVSKNINWKKCLSTTMRQTVHFKMYNVCSNGVRLKTEKTNVDVDDSLTFLQVR